MTYETDITGYGRKMGLNNVSGSGQPQLNDAAYPKN